MRDPIREARGILKGKGFDAEKYLRSMQLEKDLEAYDGNKGNMAQRGYGQNGREYC